MSIEIPTISDEIITRVNDDKSVILMKMDDSDVFYKIKGVASLVWEKLYIEKTSFDQCIADLCEEFDVSQEQLVQDIQKLFTDLKAKGLAQ
jgi:hypothetical protein